MGYSTLQATGYRGAPTRAHLVDKADILRYVHLIFFSVKGYGVLGRPSYFLLVFSIAITYRSWFLIYIYIYYI